MARIDDAEQDYINGMKYKDIATKYDVSVNTVKSWRTRHKWRKKGAPRASKKGAPPSNQYAVGNKGGGAPSGNKNAVTTGQYETITMGALTKEEQVIFEQVTDDPLVTINTQIRELKVRQFRIQKRINVLQGDSKPESNKFTSFIIPKGSNKPISTGGTVTEYRKVDDLIKLEYALTSVNNSLLRATHEKQRMIESLGNNHGGQQVTSFDEMDTGELERHLERLEGESDADDS
ncbi:phage terminase small subunit [Lactiplantibacillus nangangensis]|uniref:Phage terminase small subunit n=1 Tax=Lactiplantibacillus nangangensis TaxID=2559917 RepID=A0ABW1SLL8_9LACO|nr:phage terminase small subunit [Lactiplantibacillus nangangensis]